MASFFNSVGYNFYLLRVYYAQRVIDLANEYPCQAIQHPLSLVSFHHSTVSTVTWDSVSNKKMQHHNQGLISQQRQKQQEMSQAEGKRLGLPPGLGRLTRSGPG